ncbi:MAG: TIGR04165 family Cys-rich peptide [Methanobacteriales archaeon]|jgi:Cys-rich peptide (TIGR04165 family)|nr:TIGR04165 family Cys-rich peptide [Methanobacteriales archaeon]
MFKIWREDKKMKFEDLFKECPRCGSKDKIVKRKIVDEHKAFATLREIVCEKCGYVFQKGE